MSNSSDGEHLKYEYFISSAYRLKNLGGRADDWHGCACSFEPHCDHKKTSEDILCAVRDALEIYRDDGRATQEAENLFKKNNSSIKDIKNVIDAFYAAEDDRKAALKN